MKKVIQKVLLGFLGLSLCAAPLVGYAIYGLSQTKVYTKTYFAALIDKIEYLEKNKDKQKIVLIGGSNVAFGFDSAKLQEVYPEYEVVNFGLYAALGTKIMIDLSKDYINKNDLVFIIPEVNEQSMSLYFNGENTLCALEENLSYIKKLPSDDQKSCLYSSIDFIKERKRIGQEITPDGVYARKNFNAHFDIEYLDKDENGKAYRAYNRMDLHYDPSMPISFDFELDEDFINYLNEYTKFVKDKGANVYYGFSPVNEKAVVYEESKESSLIDFYKRLNNALDMEIVGKPATYVMEAEYFYDSNFHLNDSGAINRTVYFAEDMNEYCEEFQDDLREINFETAAKPPFINNGEVGEDSPTASYFEYKESDGAYLITDVKKEYRNLETFELPTVYDHSNVIGIDANAFKNSKITQLTLPKEIKVLIDGAFGNCPTLSKVYIESSDPTIFSISYDGHLVDGVVNGFKFYIPKGSLTQYETNYYWRNYKPYLAEY